MTQAENSDTAKSSLESIKSAYDSYKSALNTYNDAKETLTKAVDSYNDKVRQLDALVKQKALNDAKANYSTELDSYLSDLKKTATESTQTISYKNADGTTVKITTSETNESKAEKIETMINDLRTQLTNLESAESVGNITGTVTIGGQAVKVSGSPTSNPATSTVTSELINNNRTSTETAVTLDLKLKQAAAEVTAQRQLITSAEYDVAGVLGEAMKGIVKENSGPAILSGDKIGTNANGDMVTTSSGSNGITFTAANSGVKGQIAGFTISVSDSEGNIKKSVNASLDAFEETIRAVDKSEDNAISLQVGAKANQAIKVGLTDMRSEALGLKGSDGTKLDIQTRERANAAINVLDNALQKALDQQTTIGSIESRLEYTSSNLTTASENVQASESTIRDADMAKEMTNYTKNNVLLQAAQSMLAQANQNSSAVLSLLQ
jgi:flagellin